MKISDRWYPFLWAGVYFVAAYSAIRLLSSGVYDVVLFWIPSGIYWAALVHTAGHRKRTRGLASSLLLVSILLFAANWFANTLGGNGPYAAVYSLINTGEAYLLFFLWRVAGRYPLMEQPVPRLLIFALLSVLTAALSGLIAALYNPGLPAGWSKVAAAWFGWGRSVFLGMILVGYPLGTMFHRSRISPGRLELFVCSFLLTAATWFVYGYHGVAVHSGTVLSFLTAPFFIWAGLRFGIRMTAGFVLYAALISTVFINLPRTAATVSSGFVEYERVLLLQVFLFVFGVIAFVLSAAIEQLKSVYRELESSERRFRLLAENARDGLFRMLLPEGRYQYLSPSIERITGVPLEELYANPVMVRDLVTEEWLPIFDTYWAKLLDGDFPEELEFPIIHRRSGEVVWLLQRNTLIYDHGPSVRAVTDAPGQPSPDMHSKPVAIEGLVIDISARREMEQKIKEVNDRLMLALRIGRMVWWEWSRSTDKVRIGAEMNFFSDRSALKHEFRLKDNFDSIHPDDREKLTGAMESLRSGAISSNDLTYRIKDGNRWVWVRDISETVQRDRSGAAESIIGVIINIDSVKRMESELLRSQKLESLGVLAGGIAHDFNNVLTALLGNISLAKMQLEDAGLSISRISDAEAAVSRAQALTAQLLTFSSGGEPVCENFDLLPAVKDTVTELVQGSSITCIYSFPGETVQLYADRSQVMEVIRNLVKNAVTAMAAGTGELAVTAEVRTVSDRDAATVDLTAGEYLCLSFQDNGSGIEERLQKQIFDPYFTTGRDRTGLGLTVVYSIMRQHGGCVTLHSEPGIGSRFVLYFPHTAAETHATAVSEDQTESGAGQRILVMDDDVFVGEALVRMAEQLGYRCELVDNGEGAVAEVAKAAEAGNPYHCVIMDLTVRNGMGGVDTVGILRGQYCNLKTVVSSGYSNDPVLAHFRDYGFDAVLVKPVQLKKLSEVLGTVCR